MTPGINDLAFQRYYGSYLYNVKAGLPPDGNRPGTCRICAGVVNTGFGTCRNCEVVLDITTRNHQPFPLDHLAFLTYAVEGPHTFTQPSEDSGESALDRKGRQAYLVLKGYKAENNYNPWLHPAEIMTRWFIGKWHPRGFDISDPRYLWATVPSVRSGRLGEHPLHQMITAILGADREVGIASTVRYGPRQFDPTTFLSDTIPRGNPVLLIDDSWATGYNALSVAAALKKGGTERVYAMVLGRLLNPSKWAPAARFIEHGGLDRPFDVNQSPWIETL